MAGKKNAAVAIFDHHDQAEAAIKELNGAGVVSKKLSIVGRDYHTEEDVFGCYNAGDRMKYWGKAGAIWDGIWGLLFGSAFFWVPGLGPLVVGGPLASWSIGALEGAAVAGGLSALGAGLFSIGIPEDSILSYEAAIRSDKFLGVAHGSSDDVHKAREILEGSPAALIGNPLRRRQLGQACVGASPHAGRSPRRVQPQHRRQERSKPRGSVVDEMPA